MLLHMRSRFEGLDSVSAAQRFFSPFCVLCGWLKQLSTQDRMGPTRASDALTALAFAYFRACVLRGRGPFSGNERHSSGERVATSVAEYELYCE